MDFDVIVVTYNSSKWISTFFRSLSKCNYKMDQLNIVIIDNYSSDDTVKKVEEYKESYGSLYKSFVIINKDANTGFGHANNIGVKTSKSKIIFFTNIDTEIFPETFNKLEKIIEHSPESVALWEFRQLPYEHPKTYNILTHEVSWSSGAAFAIRREVYEKIGGFDSKIFMYGEDVDLSWRIRNLGYTLRYCPNIPIIHHAYEETEKPKDTQFVYGTIYNTLLRYRYGSLVDIVVGHIYALANLLRTKPCDYSRKKFISTYIQQMKYIPHFIQYRFQQKKDRTFKPKFLKMQYEDMRQGAFYPCQLPQNQPLVSIIVRTCQRPEILKEAIKSCLNQTYEHIEVVVVEDGPNVSEEVIRTEFQDKRIRYYATGKKVGRSKAGNIGLEKAEGEYCGFLDDDDLYYADHIEVLVSRLDKSSSQVAYALAEESQVVITSREPYTYKEVSRVNFYKQSFNRTLLFYHNYIPIQCVLFERNLFLQYGGLDTKLDALEDWDLWVRYACYTDFEYVEKVTSIYKVPFKPQDSIRRQEVLDDALEKVRQKHKGYQVVCEAGNVGSEVVDILEIYKVSKFKRIGKKIKNRFPIAFKLLLKIKRIIK